MTAIARDDPNIEHENRITESCHTDDEDEISREGKFTVKDFVETNFPPWSESLWTKY